MSDKERKQVDEWYEVYINYYGDKIARQKAIKKVFKSDLDKHINDYNEDVCYQF